MRSIKTEGVVVDLALHRARKFCGELVEIVVVVGQLVEALEELEHALGVTDLRVALAAVGNVGEAQQLAGAVPDEASHGVFYSRDMAFEFRAVFGPVGEAFDVFGI